MKLGILTFHFAYNFGAMLQAFALKKYLCDCGYNADIIPYYPSKFKASYAASPLTDGLTIKKRIGKALTYFQRKPQANMFEAFKKECLYTFHDTEFNEREDIKKYLNKYDVIIYGSDQIWNTNISFNDSVYWGTNFDKIKISYAASMGTQELSKEQLELLNNLHAYAAVSVREPTSQMIVQERCGISPKIVCDPVFLYPQNEWSKMERKLAVVEKPYLLLYLLQQDPYLVEKTLSYAKKCGCRVYSIHPTQSIYPKGTIPIKNIGPREFLFLVEHAMCVSTNSFHCVAFSVIFKKHLLHIPNVKSPERTISLLQLIGALPQNDWYDVEIGELDFSALNNMIDNSKQFLTNALEKAIQLT